MAFLGGRKRDRECESKRERERGGYISGKTPGRVGKKLMLSKLFSPFIFRSLARFSLTFLVCQSYTIF